MKIVVSGSTGLIGSVLTEALLRRDHEVVPLLRRRLAPGEHAIAWDPERATIDRAGLEGADAVIHLAGENVFGRCQRRRNNGSATAAYRARDCCATRSPGCGIRRLRCWRRPPSGTMATAATNRSPRRARRGRIFWRTWPATGRRPPRRPREPASAWSTCETGSC